MSPGDNQSGELFLQTSSTSIGHPIGTAEKVCTPAFFGSTLAQMKDHFTSGYTFRQRVVFEQAPPHDRLTIG